MAIFHLTKQYRLFLLSLWVGLCICVLAGWQARARSQSNPPHLLSELSSQAEAAPSAQGLATALQADGSLKPGLSGSFDPSGYRLATATNGAPRFVANQINPDDRWDNQFNRPEINGEVQSILVVGNIVYVGGDFTTAGKITANHIARWDGSQWTALGSGVNGRVLALAAAGNDLYVGGSFNMAGGAPAKSIAKWNGSSWSALGSGLDGGGVAAIAINGTDVYAAGSFTTAGTLSARRIAKWNGSEWSALGTGLGAGIITIGLALAVCGNDLYVGGSFADVNGLPIVNIAKWDGQNWSPLGTGVYGGFFGVYSMAISGNDLYVGGDFTTAGGQPASGVAKWDGTTWTALGSGLAGLNAREARALIVNAGQLYVCGLFTTAGGVTVNNIAQWNGSSWLPLGTGLAGVGRALAVQNNKLYAGGDFTAAGNAATKNLAQWNGIAWSALDSPPNNGLSIDTGTVAVNALANAGNELYAAGNFTQAGELSADSIVKWNGNAWSAVGSGATNGIVYALAVKGNELYAGGGFSTIGGVNANGIAKWDGNSWAALGSGITGTVAAITFIGNDLYAAGSFNLAGGIPAQNVAKWNGNQWVALGGGIPSPGTISSLAVVGNLLYAAGYFTQAGNTTAANIAKWDGQTWSALGNGLNSQALALATRGDDLYVGGYFTQVGNINAQHIAKWDGQAWHTLGTGISVNAISTFVSALAFAGNNLYVGGNFSFSTATGLANNVARWDGYSWSPLGSGTNKTIYALASSGRDLYAGGEFTVAGQKPSLYFGRYLNVTAPTIQAINNITRPQSTTAAAVTIATVTDADEALNTLTVTINGAASATANGITLSGLTVNAAGQISASVAAAANAANATFTLRVTDNAGDFAETALTITVVRASATLSDPLTCTGAGNTVAVSVSAGNPGAVPLPVVLTATLTNLVGLPGSCNLPDCVVTATGLSYNATLAPGENVTLNYLTRVADGVTTGAQVCTNNTLVFNGGQPLAVTACNTINCPATGPGALAATTSPTSAQKPGSVLIYNVFTSSASAANLQNTRISLTNTHPLNRTFVHLFFVDGASCSVADSYICLTPNQTATFLAADLDPGTSGYLVAVATDAQGCPTNFNYLIGDEFVKFSSGHAANLGALGITALASGLPLCDGNAATAELRFDGSAYNVLPHVIAADNLGAHADGNDTLLILNRLGGNLSTGAATLTGVFGVLYDDAESPVSFTFSPGTCQFRASLTNNFPRTVPRIEQFIPAGRSGWFKLSASNLAALSGAVINFNANATTNSGAFNQGHNLHQLTTTNTASYVIPVFPPNC